jgi:peptidoglycan hydrolase CwlO-like protein
MNETINKAIALSVILSAGQEIIDDIDQDMFFRNKLKYTQKNFSKELEAFISELYKNMTPEAQEEFHSRTRELKQVLKV